LVYYPSVSGNNIYYIQSLKRGTRGVNTLPSMYHDFD
jgi:hypothetical protein